ncbi:MAG: pilus assembly protein PilP [Oligoflexia bacterium]|nr:pilus assembly protein PilP [Oligoflexia bacterium]
MLWSVSLPLLATLSANAADQAHGQAAVDWESRDAPASGSELSFGDNMPIPWLPGLSWSWTEIEITGTVLADNMRQALVTDPFGNQHAVQVGDYVDYNWAQVVFVGPRHIVLRWDTPFLAADRAMCWGVLYLAPASNPALRDPFRPWSTAIDPPVVTHSVHMGCGRSKELLDERYPDLLTDAPHSHVDLGPTR